MSTAVQRSFAAGEVSPEMGARVDQVKYQTGLKTCRNWMVQKWGGIQTRPGTSFVGEVKDSSKEVRLIPFIYDETTSYILEFGNLYMRVHKNGAQVTRNPKTITGATNANPCVITSAGHSYSNGDEVIIAGIVGMTELNGRQFKVANVAANTFELKYMDGSTNVNSTGFGTYSSGGTASKVYEITTTYLEADLQDLNFAQSGNILTICHPSYPPAEVVRTPPGDKSWAISAITFAPSTSAPTSVDVTRGNSGTKNYDYRVTAVDEVTGEESYAGTGLTRTDISAITQAANAQVTYGTNHNYSNGDRIEFSGVVGMTEINGLRGTVTVVSPTIITVDINSTGFTAYTSGGQSELVGVYCDTPSYANPNVLTWTAVSGAKEYLVYRRLNGIDGFIGVATETQFIDTNIPPDVTYTPREVNNPFDASDEYPSTVTYYQQRRIFGNSNTYPSRVWGSQIGDPSNMSASRVLRDDDSLEFDIVGRNFNEIRHLLDLGRLLVFASAGEFIIQGGPAGALTPTDINAQQQGYNGSSNRRPLVIGGNAIYLQGRESVVRDFAYEVASDSRYRGNDLTIYSAHLFEGFAIRDWDYQENPHSIVWMVRDNGTMLGMTLIPEQEILGWHRHDFYGGEVEQVAVIPEGQDDRVYLVIKRTIDGLASIGGSTRRYVERMTIRHVSDIEDFVGMDSSLSRDGTNATATTMTLSGGSTWDAGEDITLTSSSSFFASTDIGNEIWLYDGDDLVRCEITAYTSGTVVTVHVDRLVPVAMRSVAISTWGYAVDQIGGLWHLEGEDISIFADGFVEASPENEDAVTVTVANGVATMANPHVVVHAGLPITSDAETLALETVQGGTLIDKKMAVSKITMYVKDTLGLFAGPDENSLRELKERASEPYDDPVALQNGKINLNMDSDWNDSGSVFVRQIDPVPATILAIAPAGFIPVGR